MTKPNASATLNPRQQRAAVMVAAGKSFTEAARAVGTTRQTVALWAGSPLFEAEVERLVEESVREAVAGLRELSGKAVGEVGRLLQSGGNERVRLEAARLVLDAVGVTERARVSVRLREGETLDVVGLLAKVGAGK